MNLLYIANRCSAVAAIAIASAALCAHQSGLLRLTDHSALDLFNSFRVATPTTDDLLLVELDSPIDPGISEAKLPQICKDLHRLGAARIGIAFPVSQESLSALQKCDFASSIVAGFRLTETLKDDQPIATTNTDIRKGFIDLLYDQVVYREHSNAISTGTDQFYSLEFELVKPILLSKAGNIPARMMIEYIGDKNSLPIVSSQLVTQGELIPELVRNRIVIIGYKNATEYDIAIPSVGAIKKISRLEVHGHVLRTILAQRYVQALSLPWTATLLLATSLISLQFYRRTSLRTSVLALLLTVLMTSLLTWLSLHSVSVQLPLSAMSLAVMLSAVQCMAFRFRIQSELVDSWTLIRQTRESREQGNARALWEQIADAAYQMFYPERLVLLQLPPSRHHLRIASTRQCQIEDIRERRRDIGRSPFLEIAKSNKALVNPSARDFFSGSEDTASVEILAPLTSGSQLHGFIVVEVSQESLNKWPGFEEFLTEYSSEIGKVIAQHANQADVLNLQGNWLDRMLVSPEEIRQARLHESDTEFSLQNQWLRRAFDFAVQPAAVFDGFGQLKFCNRAMSKVFQDNKLSINELNCVTAIQALTEKPIDGCRSTFRHCLRGNTAQTITLPQSLEILRIEPLIANTSEPLYSARGVLVQLTSSANPLESNDVNRIESSQNLLRKQVHELNAAMNDTWHDQKVLAAGGQSEVFSRVFTALKKCEELLATQPDDQPHNVTPISLTQTFKQVLTDSQTEIESKNLCLVDKTQGLAAHDENHDTSQSHDLIHANAELLTEALRTLIHYVCEHALPESGIYAFHHVSDSRRSITLESVSTGVSAERSHTDHGLAIENDTHTRTGGLILDVEAENILTSIQLERIAAIAEWMKCWNGYLQVRTSDQLQLQFSLHFDSNLHEGFKLPSDEHGTVDSRCCRPADNSIRLNTDFRLGDPIAAPKPSLNRNQTKG